MKNIYERIINRLEILTNLKVDEIQREIAYQRKEITNDDILLLYLEKPSYWNYEIKSVFLKILYNNKYDLVMTFVGEENYIKYVELFKKQKIGSINIERHESDDEIVRVTVSVSSMTCLAIAINLLSVNLTDNDLSDEFIFCD